jgi:hypothetical protein
MVTGIPCPACGMTTSWALVTHGRPREAFATHATGTLLALVALVVGMGAVIVAVQGRRLAWLPSQQVLAIMAAVLAVLVLGEWVIRLLTR